MVVKILILSILSILLLFILKVFNSFESFNVELTPMLKCGKPILPKPGSLQNQIIFDGTNQQQAQLQVQQLADLYEDGTYINSPQQNKINSVNPNLPNCLGICINQHTYTQKNSKGLYNFTPNLIGALKSDQTSQDVINTGCGTCINNYYSGLKLMKDESNKCI